MSWYQNHIVNNSHSTVNKKVKLMWNLHMKKGYFDSWCNSTEVGTDFKKLRQVILIEEFKGVFVMY